MQTLVGCPLPLFRICQQEIKGGEIRLWLQIVLRSLYRNRINEQRRPSIFFAFLWPVQLFNKRVVLRTTPFGYVALHALHPPWLGPKQRRLGRHCPSAD
ncbi:hypothetical protein D7Y28_00290 [Stenotrophomonas maltophilia]|nr:hypothetical protein [Stenotrophomonas maltophilia]